MTKALGREKFSLLRGHMGVCDRAQDHAHEASGQTGVSVVTD